MVNLKKISGIIFLRIRYIPYAYQTKSTKRILTTAL